MPVSRYRIKLICTSSEALSATNLCSECLLTAYDAFVDRNSKASDLQLKERLDKKYPKALRVYLLDVVFRDGCDSATIVLARKYQLSKRCVQEHRSGKKTTTPSKRTVHEAAKRSLPTKFTSEQNMNM